MRIAPAVLRLAFSVGVVVALAPAQQSTPVVYTVRVPEPAKRAALVTLELPTDGAASIELWMGVWSPGFYHVEDHWRRIEVLAARGRGGAA
ncbi:MAG: hypothetical protein H6835_21005, partial [Planctomycetes bacterium]|nr:hypothetical protein [Planctomycetota bacterium]